MAGIAEPTAAEAATIEAEPPSAQTSEAAGSDPENESEDSPRSSEPQAEAVDAATESRILRPSLEAPEAPATGAKSETASPTVAEVAADARNPEPGER